MGRIRKLIIAGVLFGLLPFVVSFEEIQRRVENGVITGYIYLNYAAMVGGLVAIGFAIALLRRDPERGEHAERPPRWVIIPCLLLILLGAFQIVRGAGVFPGITGCESETGSAGFCTATG